MIQASAIRRYVYEACHYASDYPDRLRCQVIDDTIRIVQYTATDLRLIDDARMAYGYLGTIFRYDVLLTRVLAEHGIKVIDLVKSDEPYNKSKVMTIKFTEMPKVVNKKFGSIVAFAVVAGVVAVILAGLAIFA